MERRECQYIGYGDVATAQHFPFFSSDCKRRGEDDGMTVTGSIEKLW
jgi:hypothetical protein